MTHSTQVVDFIGLHIGDDGNKIGCIAKITIMKEELHTGFMTVTVDVVNTASVERRRTTNDSMNLICYDVKEDKDGE